MSNPADELFFEKISHYDRPQEPVTFGIPFSRGALSRVERFALYDRPAAAGPVKLTSGEGHYRTNKVVSEREVDLGVDTAKILCDASEHQD